MSVSVLVAAFSVVTMIFSRVYMGVRDLPSGNVSFPALLVPVLIAMLMLFGIVTGQRLAWQWGRLLGLLGGAVLTFAAIFAFVDANGQSGVPAHAILLALQGLPILAMVVALGTHGSREYFRIICPQCGCSKPRGGDFMFTRAICSKCGTTW